MTITKCDVCKKVVRERSVTVTIASPRFAHYELCEKCAGRYLKPLSKKLGADAKIKEALKLK